MTETVLFESESTQSRADVAAYLRTVADNLQNNDTITLSAGGDTETVDPPASVDFEVKAERETTGGSGPDELSIEFELEWDDADHSADGETTDTGLDIS
ncbi:amphi-Trp domain-containing protein [Halobacterium salinarum]|uniref:Amphi-Trp domain-containing protein n=4 Tax=Halobacterium salinarum TaxID=2242 RepID=Q9HPX8_HALSA|nr:amphi-Trp domain-containing protein [Halobacterium salinarum]AAG19739.1 hypothetical protein VNG_1425H [Halobacterium salinarum NRC-1]MBB6088742.1 amphi-Trp domain-containing protein [Halobacterium salinarum]MCF2208418.1 amphi-Trp domain-containing protein [Halobacterium salinarum]MDL0118850.1 amphi-Trp domain-containing protein [Halobacterium salinarum]MDL0124519.1 amphi-Trp domain-containing protein [Halobacterium salinarum]